MKKGKSMVEHMRERNSMQKGPTDPKKKAGPKPIYTSDPKRVKAYNDSLSLYNKEKRLYEDETKLSYDNLLKYPASNPSGPRYGYTYSNKPLYGYKKPVQPVVYKKSDKKEAAKITAKAKPTSKPVVNVKSVVKKPEKIVMKPVSEEDSNALKAGFKKQTGKEFKSKDSDYNKLQKKLGRKPTIKEYNESLKK